MWSQAARLGGKETPGRVSACAWESGAREKQRFGFRRDSRALYVDRHSPTGPTQAQPRTWVSIAVTWCGGTRAAASMVPLTEVNRQRVFIPK